GKGETKKEKKEEGERVGPTTVGNTISGDAVGQSRRGRETGGEKDVRHTGAPKSALIFGEGHARKEKGRSGSFRPSSPAPPPASLPAKRMGRRELCRKTEEARTGCCARHCCSDGLIRLQLI
ncbi:hypothetical protein U1Q18_032520, partial [Sarracenia purpurea var. burkii]